ncbi:MAG: hypothetical protein A4S09_03385 [Proteobacteria bacterium SG_bin7]|nr:MAG: hypothetical protein A4S09_03385 [Proteobacteria bacterium SG_bin7]
MKLAEHIERYFNKVLLVSIVAGVASVVGYSYFNDKSDYEKSVEFIITHVRSVSESLINSQNESEIDRDVNLVYSAWKKTQSFDFRIRVFIDNVLVAHAGQLASFSWPSTTVIKSEILPSNHNLKIEVQVSLLETVATTLICLFVVLISLMILFKVLKDNATRTVKEISQPLEARVSWLKKASAHLQNSVKDGYTVEASKITEMEELDKSLKYLFDQFQNYERSLAKRSYDEGRVRTVNTVVHNLQNLFLIFEHRLKEAALNEHDRNKFEDVLRQIQDLSSKVLGRECRGSENDSHFTSFNLLESVNRVVDQKQEILENKRINLSLDVDPLAFKNIFAKGVRSEFEAALSNLIANSFDAIEKSGFVVVTLSSAGAFAVIEVSDTGKGIPASVLPLLTVEGRTFKPGGNGLGLFHARQTAEKMHGNLEIKSNPGKGTDVILRVPSFAKKDSDKIPVQLSEGMTLVIVDDSLLVHTTFKIVLRPHLSFIKVVSLFSELELDQWLRENDSPEIGSRFYLFDYNLKSETTNGLKLIEKYGLSLESLLVTGDADREDVIKEAERLKVRIVPKDQIGKIDFKFLGKREPQEMFLTK